MPAKLNAVISSFILVLMISCAGQNTQQQSILDKNFQGDTVNDLGKNIMVIHQDKNNNYWFGSWETGLYLFDGVSLINYSTKHGLPSNRIDEIKEDAAGNLYFSSCYPNSAVTKYDGKSFVSLTPISSSNWNIKSTDLWFRSTFDFEMKVFRYDGTQLYEMHLPQPPNLPNPFGIYSIYQDKEKNLWFGTNPVGVCRYDGKSFAWITEEDVTEFRDEGANGVRSILEDKNGDFWFNTEFRYAINDSATRISDKFYTRHPSIGGLDGKENSALDEYLSSLTDNESNLWFVTYLDGVWKYDGTKITHYTVQENGKDITLFSIYKDNTGTLWLGTHENGAYRFNGIQFEKFK